MIHALQPGPLGFLEKKKMSRGKVYIRINGGRTTKKNTQANKGSPLLSEEVNYWITLIGCSQGGLSRRGEEFFRKVFTENDYNMLTD